MITDEFRHPLYNTSSLTAILTSYQGIATNDVK